MLLKVATETISCRGYRGCCCFLKGPEKRKLSEGKEQDSFLDKRSQCWWWHCRVVVLGVGDGQPPRGCFAALLLLKLLPVVYRPSLGWPMAEQLAAVEVGLRCRTQGGIFTQQRKCTKGQEATSTWSSSTSTSTTLSSSEEGETPTDSSRSGTNHHFL